uniref:Uncharacterized protein n=1 Tax=Haemonchus contortus TaxID=6289 RepID=A0A7I4Y0M0_HAECO
MSKMQGGSPCLTLLNIERWSGIYEPELVGTRRQNPQLNYTQHGASRVPFPSQTNRSRQPTPRNNNHSREPNKTQTLHAAPVVNVTTASERPVTGQCVLQMASALIFNEASKDYQPITIILIQELRKASQRQR